MIESVSTGERAVDFGESFDLPHTLQVLQRGRGDPSIRVDPGAHRGGPGGTPGAGAWLCFRIYERTGDAGADAVTLRLDQTGSAHVRVRAAGSSPEAVEVALRRVPQLLGSNDDWSGLGVLLDACHDQTSLALARVRRRHPGLRLPATGQLMDQLVIAALEQKVTHDQARHGWRQLLRRHGERPPSSPALSAPESMRLPLSPEQLLALPSWQWHRMWVRPQASATIRRLASRASALHRLAGTPLEPERVAELAERLTSVPGAGAWTVAEALQRSHGAADLPAVGDWHLPHIVGEALSGRRTDDAGMLRLLEPWRGHRQRVIRLIGLSGFAHQRFGPMLQPADHRGR